MKKFFEKYDLVKLILSMFVITLVLSWVLKTISFGSTGEITIGDYNRMGIFHLFENGLSTFQVFGMLAAFIFVIGAFYQFLSKLSAYQKLTDSIAKKVKGKEILFSLIISLVFAALSSIVNEQIVLLSFIPFVITVCTKLNMNKLMSFITTFGAVLVGIIGSTVSDKITGINLQAFALSNGYKDSILVKIILFVLAYLIYSLFNVLYMKKNMVNNEKKTIIGFYITLLDVLALCFLAFYKFAHHMIYFYVLLGVSVLGLVAFIVYVLKFKNNKKTNKNASKKEKNVASEIACEDLFKNEIKDSNKANMIPLIIVVVLSAIVLLLAYIPWTTVFEIDWFKKAYEAVINVKVFGQPIFSYVLGGVTEFGSWSLMSVSVVLILAMLVLKLCYSVSFDDLLESCAEGCKKVGKVVAILILSYAILTLNYYFPSVPSIANKLLGKSFNVFTTMLTGLLSGTFYTEYLYAVSSVYANFTMLYPQDLSTVGVLLQSTYGLMSFITPASALLFVGLSYTDVKYKDWFKFIWKFLIIMLAIIVAIALIIK